MKSISYDLNGGLLTHNLQSNEMTYVVSLLDSEAADDALFDLFDLYDLGISFNIEMETNHENQDLSVKYQVDQGYLPLSFIKDGLTLEQKLDISLGIIDISRFFEKNSQFVLALDPVNILFHKEEKQVRILYVGIRGIMPIAKEHEGLVNDQVKKFFESLFQYTDRIFKSLPPHEQMANIQLRQSIENAKNLDELESLLRKEQEGLPNRMERLIKWQKEEEERKKQERKKAVRKKAIQKKHSLSKEDVIKIVNNYRKRKLRLNIMLGVIAIIVGVTSFFLSQKYLFPTNQMDQQMEDNLKKGKDLAALQKYEEAVQHFNKIKLTNLGKEDTQIILTSYLNAKQPQKIIELEPSLTNDIINFYIKIKDFDTIKKLKPQHPIIQFEQAIIKQDEKTVISLKDQVPLDDRRKMMIAFAMLAENDLKKALGFAKEQKQQALEETLSNIEKNDFGKAYEYVNKQSSKFLTRIMKERELDYIRKSTLADSEKKKKAEPILKEIEKLKKD
ncbi:hypothetical protein [Thermoflavimicrobium daqui]|uniref:Type VII secretion protein EssB n=1 Tax=Thermoflavimicrobium daqui TaxID=2137476 RepID=A0A364K579_9BACL|nr:hypothetical protein [Thermoflavimicrobium daqui]RAL24419.1 hypothetical protein DL897_08830 [Thermoflavimicrobium daqui]